MATYSSILAQEIPRTEEPDGLQSMGLQKSQTKQLDSHPYMTTGKNHSFDCMDLCWQSDVSAS